METKDFIGFTFDGIHSDDLGIVRVSDGDRYKEELQPEVKDITAEVPGMDGEYYFGSNYGTKEFDIDIAYDSLTEEQFRKIRRLFSDKGIHELVFDERPYKKYLVKIASPIELSFVCFEEQRKERYSKLYPRAELPNGVRMIDDGSGNRVLEKVDPWIELPGISRVYKGDGTISFVAYYPFAKNTFKVLPSASICPNVNDWAFSSGLLSASEYSNIDIFIAATGVVPAHFNIYNAGDINTGCRIFCLFDSNNTIDTLDLTYKYLATDSDVKHLRVEDVKKKGNDVGILIDTNNQLIIGLATEPVWEDFRPTYTTSNNIYNEYITYGYFFKLKPNNSASESVINIEGFDDANRIGIFYDYLYL